MPFIRQARKWHDENPHAEISLLSTGFSRGAVTAAMFTRMVDERGIQDPEGMQIDYGPAGEVRQLTATRPPLAPPGRTAQAVALLDPVATGDMNLRDVRLPPSVVSGLQISARDERRDAFPVKDILDPGRSRDGRFLNLVNPGAHSDIGGSYRLDGLAVRNGNLLSAYVNSLGDTPFAQARTVPGAPEMNVIHRSEQHQAFYTTALASVLGQRVHVKELAGTAWSLNRTDAEALDGGLRARYEVRPVALPAERIDPSPPAFLRQRPQAPEQAPSIDSWTPLFLNAPAASLQRHSDAPDAAPVAPARDGDMQPAQWNAASLAAADAAMRSGGDAGLAVRRPAAEAITPASPAQRPNPYEQDDLGQRLDAFFAAAERGDEAALDRLAEQHAQTAGFQEWDQWGQESFRQWELDQERQLAQQTQQTQHSRGFSI
ncbi:DUF2235 domain-containing protein [Xanthomonas theicola]|uniref:DUF2235 domain-containing protein n=1 Tax=Xanthomonas theicola TaxID=56464 RepID=UPI001FE50F02|nr:DUF2235 domain-containing protein [Xanthomonas theicola]